MKEIEVKILEASHKELEPKLFALGAKKLSDGELYAVFFDTVDSKIRNSNEVFRLRKEGSKTFITHKKKIPSKHVKIREETEIEVSDFDEARRLIAALGFKEIGSKKKRRVSYKFGDVKLEFDKYLDDYSFIPEFLEIESKNIEDIYKYAEMLGFSKEDCRPWSTVELVKHYSK